MAGDSRRRSAARQALRPGNWPSHVGASLQFLGASAARVRRRTATGLDHLDLVNAGWLAFQEAAAKGRPVASCYTFAEHRMEQEVVRERAARRPFVLDQRKSWRRLSPGEWRALHAFTRRHLADAPQQLRAITLLFRGRSILEVARELGVNRFHVYRLRSLAIARLTAALAA